ncbi:flagellar motor protein MotD [Oxalicibacterium flavum]|uniref:Flagellar motor protein MotD n=1 Tax=Oxalicibacterium flavum TaxID=179467 RepID=A0A8J2UJZ7_9BURK|nr:flagellar motor protein MotD [Oxalicibacterium flavum]GGC03987.1 flagellar motor protein MotD [Oxalicibacterium flavum]
MRRRRRYDDDQDNHERWLVSYADFITLLFAFFVVMYAVSSVNEGKYRILSDSLGIAFSGLRPQAPVVDSPIESQRPALPLPLPVPRRPNNDAAIKKEREQMTGIARNLLAAMAPLVDQGKVRVTQTERGVSVEINASVLFAPAEARLSPQSEKTLRAVAEVLTQVDNQIQVEGHTDNVPISNPMFPSNWELSAVRASSVVRLFIDAGIAEGRLLAVGHGANQPVASNDTAEGRLRNRRVQLMIQSGLPEAVTEVPIKP